MTRYDFFQKILTQLYDIQTALNTLRQTIKDEIQNDAINQSREERKDLR